MKKWQPMQVATGGVPEFIAAPVVQNQSAIYEFFKCIGCMTKADVLFDGSSYCEGCLKERLRTGK